MHTTSDGSFGRGQGKLSKNVRQYGCWVVMAGWLFAVPQFVQAGGSCTTNADCNLSPNYCKPGVCDLFHQCQYQHTDTMCRGARVCIGGTNNLQCCGNCGSPVTCPGGTCSTGLCAGGTKAGNPCAINADCPGSTCTQGANHDNLYCNGDDFCNETTQRCDVNPVSCQSPTPICDETTDSCVECTSNTNCPAGTCQGGPRNGLSCHARSDCPACTGCSSYVDCAGGEICSSNGSCVQCATNQDCNDGLFCNGQESCNANSCQDGTPPTCTTKRCFGGTNIGAVCTSNANCPGGGTCELEFCDESFRCEGGTNDDLACKTNANCPGGLCKQGCTQCEGDEDCDDGQFCNGQEVCNQLGRCAAGTPPTCRRCNGGTFAVCTSDADCPGTSCGPAGSGFCDETFNRCVQCLNSSHCPPDLVFCTEAACLENDHTCAQISNPVGRCGDGVHCNGDEVCLSNQANSVCTNCMIFHPSTCSGGTRNGLTCSIGTDCPGGSCVARDADCKGKVCNSSATSPPYKSCTTSANCPAGVQCVDACCGAGTAVDCEDGVSCTLNKCNEGTDSCTTTIPTKTCNNAARSPCETNADCPSPSLCSGGAYCDNGLYCDGQEVCTQSGCVNNTPRVCKQLELETPCTSNADCSHCSGGSNNGESCSVAADCPGGTCSNGTCEVDCRSFTSQCTSGDCNESSDQCVGTPIRIGQACEDGTACTINEICTSSGVCTPNPGIPTSDSYRCVKLEWRNVTPTSVFPGQTVTADLYAVADGCGAAYAGNCPSGNADIVGLRALVKWNKVQLSLDPPATSNPLDPCNSGGNTCYRCQTCTGGSNPGAKCVKRCSAGPHYGFACLTDAECSQICNGGTQNGMPCTGSANCPGGTCGVAGATCSSTVNTCLGGPNAGLPCTVAADCPSTPGDPPASCSTQFTCQGGGTCSNVPSPSQYDWSSSAFLNDCPAPGLAGDGINGPCPYTGFPGNDGNALYTAFDQLVPCMPNGESYPACVPTGGLFLTKFRFRAQAGGSSVLDFEPCLGTNSKTAVTSSVSPPPPLTSSDVLKSVTPSVSITVKCNTNAECNDQNPCTSETCNTTTNLCTFTNNNGVACDDGLFCTLTDTCSNGVCIGGGARCTGTGQCVGGSNPGAACTSHAQCTNGWCNADTICDETNRCAGGSNGGAACTTNAECPGSTCAAGLCVECLSSTSCKDNSICTQDVCSTMGLCQNPPVNCEDGLSCTTDTCAVTSLNPPMYECRHTGNDAACATGQFCSAKLCDPTANPSSNPTGCVFDHQCVSNNGNPCDNPATCNETNDNCGGCLTLTATGSGAHYLKITPNTGQGATPVAVLIEGDCNQSAVSCVSKYLSPTCVGGANDGLACVSDADCPKRCLSGQSNGNACTTDSNCPGGSCRGFCDKGLLGTTPVYMPASSWGTVQAHAGELRPSSSYHVYSVCNFSGTPTISAAVKAKMPKWSDSRPDDIVDFGDIAALVNAFKNVYSAVETFQSTNLLGVGATVCGDPQAGCFGQECINFGDVAAAVDAFRGSSYPCPAICP